MPSHGLGYHTYLSKFLILIRLCSKMSMTMVLRNDLRNHTCPYTFYKNLKKQSKSYWVVMFLDPFGTTEEVEIM